MHRCACPAGLPSNKMCALSISTSRLQVSNKPTDVFACPGLGAVPGQAIHTRSVKPYAVYCLIRHGIVNRPVHLSHYSSVAASSDKLRPSYKRSWSNRRSTSKQRDPAQRQLSEWCNAHTTSKTLDHESYFIRQRLERTQLN